VGRRKLGRWFEECFIRPAASSGHMKRYRLDQLIDVLRLKGSAGAGIDAARARKLAAEAGILEMKVKKVQSEVVDIEVMRQVVECAHRAVRDRVLRFPSAVAPLVVEATTADARTILMNEVVKVLEDLSEGLEFDVPDFDEDEADEAEEAA
jgi:nucleoside-triphosphatase THEP1